MREPKLLLFKMRLSVRSLILWIWNLFSLIKRESLSDYRIKHMFAKIISVICTTIIMVYNKILNLLQNMKQSAFFSYVPRLKL